MINEILGLEQKYKSEGYYHEPNGILLIQGFIPVIVSAPHSVKHLRNDIIKNEDMLTGGIAEYLGKITDCHVITNLSSMSDPNYDSDSPYRRILLEYIKKNNIKYLLDLHGASYLNDFSIDIGTSPGNDKMLNSFHNNNKLFNDVVSILSNTPILNKLPITVNHKFKAGKRTITYFASHNSDCKCLQLEINGKYRYYKEPEYIEALITGLSTVIKYLSIN